MGFFESLFYTIWRGFAIGILISAPMGPVGILCIQRTLDKGRKTGLYTGIGAAISDLFYCIFTGFGLSFIEDFLERNHNIIQLVGSVVLIAFAAYLFKKNPASSLKTPTEEINPVSPHKNILGGFFFTFSNPLILFLIIGLFARFNFTVPEINFYYYIAGYIAIFTGACLWWEFVTFTVNKLRSHFNLRSMWLINKIIAGIILIFAIVGICTAISNEAFSQNTSFHWNEERGYKPFRYATPQGIYIENKTDSIIYDYYKLPDVSEHLRLAFRAKNFNGNPSKSYPYYSARGKRQMVKYPSWGFFITSSIDTVAVSVSQKEEYSGVESFPAAEIKVYNFKNHTVQDVRLSKGLNPYSGDNLWVISNKDGGLSISAGDTGLNEVFSSAGLPGDVTGIGFYAGWGSDILVSDINLDTSIPKAGESESLDIENIREYLKNSQDPMEGYWSVYDRELEESLLKMGGTYILACIRKDDDYYFLYLEGSSVNKSNWKPGDVKIKLSPSAFDGLYNVEWWDSLKLPLNKEVMAQKGEGNTLLIQFPYQSSKLRLRKFN